MLHFVMSYMKQKKRKQTRKSAQYGLERIFKRAVHFPTNFGSSNTTKCIDGSKAE